MVNGAGGGFSKKQNSRQEYYYNYFWEIENLFAGPPDELPADWTNPTSPLIGVKDTSLPTFTVNKETYNGASLEYKFAKGVTWEDIKIVWYDSIGLLKVMKDWRGNVWSPECGLAEANHYKRRSTLNYFLPTGKMVNNWTLHNSWPSQIRHGDLTYTSSDVKIIEVTVTYDWAVESPAQ